MKPLTLWDRIENLISIFTNASFFRLFIGYLYPCIYRRGYLYPFINKASKLGLKEMHDIGIKHNIFMSLWDLYGNILLAIGFFI